jgi:aspartate racemase
MAEAGTLWSAVGAAVRAQRDAPPLVPVPRDAGALRASFAQRRLWFLDRLAGPSALLNQAVACRLQGRLHAGALAGALSGMVRRHEPLRTAFEFSGGELVQRILPLDGLPLPLDDLRAGDASGREALAHALASEEARRPFDAAQPPLLRARLLRLRDDEHWLVLTFHHLAFDGWSFEVFMAELCAVYDALALGRPSPLAPPRIQFADFAAWQRRWLDEERLRPLLDRWVARMAAPRAELRLPSDRARAAPPPRPGASASIVLSPELTGAVKALCASERATPYMVLLAAFLAVLHRHSGQDDLIVGSPVANRNRAGLESMVGLLANTLPLRVSLAGAPTFRELVARVRAEALEAFAHQDLPFEMLVEALGLPRGADALPLVRVMFAYQNVPPSSWAFRELRAEAWNVDAGVAKFDLALSMKEAGGCFHGLAEYDASLFDAARIEDLLGHLRAFLEAVAADADARVDAVELLSAAERGRWLADWNATTTPFPREPIHRLFEAVARDRPGAPALLFEAGAWTYAELERCANRLARHLAAQGVRPGELVVVRLERSPDLVAALLAVLKAGAAYVPSAPSEPDGRLREALAGSAVAAIISRGPAACALDALARCRVRLDLDAAAIAQQPCAELDIAGDANALAYVMFTSGSSGTPKGVCIPHRGVTRLVRATNYVSISPGDVLAQLAPVGFDASTFEIWGALLNGAALALPAPGALALREIGGTLRARRVTVAFLTTRLFEAFVDERPEDLDAVRELLVGGEAMSPSHARAFLRRGARCRLVNVYGPTENTTFTTFHPLAAVPEDMASIPIGRPIANTRLYVMDADLRPVPPGAVGEACVAGEGLMNGYLGDAALTREKLRPDPLAPGRLLYRTGDRVRLRRDGALEFIGRLDDQVKVRGFRVEPGEVESMLARCPGVERAAVVAHRCAVGGVRLAAYLVAAPGAAASLPAAAREFVRARLPEAWVPETWMLVDGLPLTPHGKVDRTALAAGAGASPVLPAAGTAPRDPLEEVLARAFATVLGVDAVGIDDDFFERGGHSLLALRLLERIERDLAAPIPLAQLFRHRTVAALAAALRARPADIAGARPLRVGALVEVRPGTGEPALFVIPGGHGGMLEMTLYAKLMACVEGDLAVYGLLASAPEAAAPDARSVADMADAFLSEIRRVRPRGPYALAGECVGGVVAFEMAQRLRAQGEVVSLLLLDSWCPTDAGERHYWRVERRRVVARERAAMALAGLRGLARVLREHVRARPAFGVRAWTTHACRGAAGLWRRAGVRLALIAKVGTTPGLGSERADALARTYVEQAMRYRAQPYAGPIRLVISASNHALGLARDWERVARGGLEVRVVPGSHETYIRDTAAQTARALQGWLPVREGGPR